MRLKSLSPKRTGFERIAGDEEKSVRVSPTFLETDAAGGQTASPGGSREGDLVLFLLSVQIRRFQELLEGETLRWALAGGKLPVRKAIGCRASRRRT